MAQTRGNCCTLEANHSSPPPEYQRFIAYLASSSEVHSDVELVSHGHVQRVENIPKTEYERGFYEEPS